MKKFRIRPDINVTEQVWALDQKMGLKWKKIMRHEDINLVKRMKDHLLKEPIIYTQKDNVPEQPLRTRPSSWPFKTKKVKIQMKRSDLPPSMQ